MASVNEHFCGKSAKLVWREIRKRVAAGLLLYSLSLYAFCSVLRNVRGWKNHVRKFVGSQQSFLSRKLERPISDQYLKYNDIPTL